MDDERILAVQDAACCSYESARKALYHGGTGASLAAYVGLANSFESQRKSPDLTDLALAWPAVKEGPITGLLQRVKVVQAETGRPRPQVTQFLRENQGDVVLAIHELG